MSEQAYPRCGRRLYPPLRQLSEAQGGSWGVPAERLWGQIAFCMEAAEKQSKRSVGEDMYCVQMY